MASTEYVPPTNGIVGGYGGDNINILRAMIAFSAIAWYNCVELIFLICLRFKRWRGLYFWSLIVTSWAIILYQIGSWGKMQNIITGDQAVMTAFTNIGWVLMIGGNSLVLYSRLHLLTQNQTLLKCVLYGIIINTFCMYVPTTALDWGANVVHPENQIYVHGYSIMERIQMTLFTIQEFVISGIYLWEAYRYLKVTYMGDKRSRNIMYELLAVNVTIIVLDIALLAVAHKDLFAVEVTLKGLVYSIKLKLELGVLSRLVRIVTGGGSGLQRTTTFENDLANISDEPKAFNGLDFCTSPLADKTEAVDKSSTDSAKSASNTSRDKDRKGRNSVPWLTAAPRTRAVEPKSPLSPPPIHQAPQHPVQREDYANSEFLTSAAVSEGANDDNIRQFQREIDAELGLVVPTSLQVRRMHRSVPSSESTITEEKGRAQTRKASKQESIMSHDEDEEECLRSLGVLGRPATAEGERVRSRDSSLERMYPGRITGDNG